jgi:hypothetical protein
VLVKIDKKLLSLLSIILLTAVGRTCAQEAVLSTSTGTAIIAIFYSSHTRNNFINLGWNYDEYIGYIKKNMDSIGIKYEMILSLDINEIARRYKLLILPNVRDMSREEAEILNKYVNTGGKIFATYQTSFRDENDEYYLDPVTGLRNFMLSGIFCVKFVSWVGMPPKCAYIKFVEDIGPTHPVRKELKDLVRVFRYTSMEVSKLDDNKGKVLAIWYDEDKTTPSFPQEANISLIEGNNCIYCAEDLFAPENVHNKYVKRLIKNIIEYLLIQK